jgi:poly(3-hydroxybutyrate) depolymerase
MMRRAIVVLVTVLASLAASAATPVPSGKWSFVFNDRKGHADRPIRVYTYRPRQCDSRCPMLFALPGSKRNASEMREAWESAADRHAFLLIVPEFSAKVWPGAAAYQLGGIAGESIAAKWTFSAIENLFEEMRDGQADYRVYGYAAGAQLVHRMLLFRPDSRASVVIAGNPGVFTMPEWRKEKLDAKFPFALVETAAGEAQVRQALARRLVLLVGENDNDPDEENQLASDGAKKQGASRVERGENFFKMGTALASELGVKFAWELVEMPDTAKDAISVAKAAAEAAFGTPK